MKISYPIILLILFISQPSTIEFDEIEVQSLVATFFNKVEAFVNEENYKAYDVLLKPGGENTLLKDETIDQDSAINNLTIDNLENFDYYIALLEEELGNIKIKFYDDKIDECIYYLNGIPTIRVEFTQRLELLNLNKIKINKYDIGISIVRKENYRIEYVRRVGNIEYPSNNCSSNENDIIIEEKNKFKVLKKKQLEKADELFKSKKHIEARNIYKTIYQSEIQNKTIFNKIEKCNNIISKESFKKHINLLASIGQYKKALKEINSVSYDNDNEYKIWIKEKKNELNLAILKQDYEKRIKIANTYFRDGEFQKAKKYYVELLDSEFTNQSYLNDKIKRCNEGDPLFVSKLLKTAYINAKKSRKNFLSTFQIYYKYESSGLLSGANYHFMCLMMLEGNRSIKKDFNFDKTKMKYLSKEYFYKAKDLGYNNSLVENQIFTRNIKNRKN